MNPRILPPIRRAALALLVAALLASQVGRLGAVADPAAPTATDAEVTLTGLPAAVEAPPLPPKDAHARLDSQLAQLYESAVLPALGRPGGSGRSVDTFAGQAHIDLAAGTARVILEMDVDPQAHPTGPAALETVILDDGRTATIEHAPPTAVRADLAAAIAAAGATFELGVQDLVQVVAPFRSLKVLSEIPGVRLVRLPLPAQEQALPAAAPEAGSQTSEGVGLTRTDGAHAAGYDGTDVNLAVFDSGFTGWATRQAADDLPADAYLVKKDYSAAYSFSPDTSGFAHGTACAEIAYDMAPGTGQSPTTGNLYLYAWGTDAEFVNAVNDYKGTGITGRKVATMSILWVNAGPYDGTGAASGPDTKVNEAQAAGVFWANAAGNYQSQHYSWTSARYSNTDYVAFGSGNVEGIGATPGSLWSVASGTVLRVYLEWNDWNSARTGDQSNIDYNLYLYRWTGSNWTQVASSTGNQCSDSVPPTEGIAYTVPNGGPYNYGVLISRYQSGCTNGFGHWMQLFTFNGFYSAGTGMVPSFWYGNACNSVTIPADADGAAAVGASFWGEDGSAAYDYGLETFSSLGPRNASGGANPGSTVNKPDLVAPDGVSTATSGASNGLPYRTFGSTGFWGTSAGAPHTAGLAAALWEQYPSDTPAELRAKVQSYALCRGGGGACGSQGACTPQLGGPGGAEAGLMNNRFGWGRIGYWEPTRVKLARFEAWAEGAAIHVEWETTEEIDNLGFHLYRARRPDGERTRLNEALIPSRVPPGSPFGAVYDWIDGAVRPGAAYYYWLEDVDVYGHRTMHGPVKAVTPPQGPGIGPDPGEGAAP